MHHYELKCLAERLICYFQGHGHYKSSYDQNRQFLCIFWNADSFATKLGLIVHYHKLECFMGKWDCGVQGQGHSRISKCQWMFVQMIFSELLNLLLPNVVWWCIIQAWELCAAWRMYTPVKFTACPKIFPVHLKALKKKFRNCLCASSHMGKCQQVLCCLSEPISLGINFYFWACAVRYLIDHCIFWTLGTSAMLRLWANEHGLLNWYWSTLWQLLWWKL